jgi:alkanesulfonate monooxygenase SsuD/methylene tetrahydromethanopterin reductase-like flavin-dependent oxidoreductase (luciferase family)
MDFAARYADAVFSVAHSLPDAAAYAKDLGQRLSAYRRAEDAILIFPGLVTVIGSTEAEAKRREEQLWELVPIEYGLRRLAGILQVDPAVLKLDQPLPRNLKLPVDGMQTFFKGALTLAERGGLTVRQLIRAQGGGTGHRIIVGTPDSVADSIETWFRSGAVAGFNIMPDVIASGLEAFVDHVVPLLRQRGIFRNAYDGTTLRDHFGLARPVWTHPVSTCPAAKMRAASH